MLGQAQFLLLNTKIQQSVAERNRSSRSIAFNPRVATKQLYFKELSFDELFIVKVTNFFQLYYCSSDSINFLIGTWSMVAYGNS